MTPEEKIAFKSLTTYYSDNPNFDDWLFNHLNRAVDREIAKRIWIMEITYENQNGQPFEAMFGKKCNYERLGCSVMNLEGYLSEEPSLNVEPLQKALTSIETIKQVMQPVLNPIKKIGLKDWIYIGIAISGLIISFLAL